MNVEELIQREIEKYHESQRHYWTQRGYAMPPLGEFHADEKRGRQYEEKQREKSRVLRESEERAARREAEAVKGLRKKGLFEISTDLGTTRIGLGYRSDRFSDIELVEGCAGRWHPSVPTVQLFRNVDALRDFETKMRQNRESERKLKGRGVNPERSRPWPASMLRAMAVAVPISIERIERIIADVHAQQLERYGVLSKKPVLVPLTPNTAGFQGILEIRLKEVKK